MRRIIRNKHRTSGRGWESFKCGHIWGSCDCSTSMSVTHTETCKAWAAVCFILSIILIFVMLVHRVFETIQVAKINHFKNKHTKGSGPQRSPGLGRNSGSFGQLLWHLDKSKALLDHSFAYNHEGYFSSVLTFLFVEWRMAGVHPMGWVTSS